MLPLAGRPLMHSSDSRLLQGGFADQSCQAADRVCACLPFGKNRFTCERIELKGESLANASRRRWRQLRGDRIAMIFQDPMTALDPCYRIGDQMCEILQQNRHISRRSARERSVELLRKVGIPSPEERLSQFPHQLSGGLRQRVMIAMALLCEPELIIADEPPSALDVSVQSQILNLLHRLKQELDLTMILISHNLAVVHHLADEVAVMYLGQIVERGPSEAIFRRPHHPYADALLKAVLSPRPGSRLPDLGLQAEFPSPLNPPSGCAFHPRCPNAGEVCTQAAPQPVGGSHSFRCHSPMNLAAPAEDAMAISG